MDTTWKLADQRPELGKKSRANQGERRVLSRRFQAALKEDMRSRVKRAGEDIDALLSNDQLIEAWSKTQRWYLEAKGHQVHHTSDKLYQNSTLREDLYWQCPPKGESIPIPDGPPVLTGRSFLTAAVISPNYGDPSAILTGCTRIGMLSPFGGHCL